MKIIESGTQTILVDAKDSDIANETFITPEEVNVIGTNAFQRLKNLRYLNIPQNVKLVCFFAFWKSNLETIQFENPNTRLATSVFCECSKLKDV